MGGGGSVELLVTNVPQSHLSLFQQLSSRLEYLQLDLGIVVNVLRSF